MQNRFGLKDFVMLVLALVTILVVWLAIYQEDRRWTKVEAMGSTLVRIEQILSRVENRLEQGLEQGLARGPGSPADSSSSSPSSAQAAAPAARVEPSTPTKDESWARRDVAIQWQPPWAAAHDPRRAEGFAVGGEFTEIFEGQPSKIVPYLIQDVYGRRIADIVCDSLGAFDPMTLEFRGTLAEAWQYDPAGLWLRVRLIPRARFSDGQPVTAEDVRWTFHDFIMNPEIEAERARSTLDNIKQVVVIDERTVEFQFGEAMFTNLTYTMGFYILPKHFYSRFTPSQINKSTGLLMGSGPFRLGSLDPDNQWTPGTDVVLARNESYWGAKPPLAGMRFKTVTDELSRLTSYRNNEGDMMLPSSPQFNQVTREPGWGETSYSLNWINMRSGYSFVAWQCGPRRGKLTPFHDRRVRMAMTHLLDRERMIRDIWDGVGVVAKGSNNPESPASNRDLSPWPFDMARARELLAEAGWMDRDGNGVLENDAGAEFTFEFTRSSGGEIHERISTYIRDQCAKAGIRCNVRVVDWSVYAELLKGRDFDAIIMSWSASSPESDPKQIWHSSSILDQGDNFIQWSNPEADALIDAIRRELDHDKRMKLWHQFEALLYAEQPYTFVRVVPWLRFIRKNFGNVQTYRTGLEMAEFFRRTAGPASLSPGG